MSTSMIQAAPVAVASSSLHHFSHFFKTPVSPPSTDFSQCWAASVSSSSTQQQALNAEMLMASEFPQEMLSTLANILTDLCETNDSRHCPVISKFHAASKPSISIKDYLLRVCQYAECSDACFILAFIYIDRIQTHPDFIVNSLNIHRLLITSIMLAAKFFDDHYYNNAFYARIGGVSKEEMNQLELEFLFMISFALSVSHEEYKQYDFELRALHAASLNIALPSRPSSSAASPCNSSHPADMHLDWSPSSDNSFDTETTPFPQSSFLPSSSPPPTTVADSDDNSSNHQTHSMFPVSEPLSLQPFTTNFTWPSDFAGFGVQASSKPTDCAPGFNMFLDWDASCRLAASRPAFKAESVLNNVSACHLSNSNEGPQGFVAAQAIRAPQLAPVYEQQQQAQNPQTNGSFPTAPSAFAQQQQQQQQQQHQQQQQQQHQHQQQQQHMAQSNRTAPPNDLYGAHRLVTPGGFSRAPSSYPCFNDEFARAVPNLASTTKAQSPLKCLGRMSVHTTAMQIPISVGGPEGLNFGSVNNLYRLFCHG